MNERQRLFVTVAGCALLVFGWLLQAPAQTVPRRLTTIESLRRFPGYFHLQNVLLRGELVENGSRITFRADDHDIDILLGEGARTTTGPVEIRGQLIDVGRLEPGDSRLSRYTGARDQERWPKPGEELLLSVTAVGPAEPFTRPSIRALALEPWRFEGQMITVVGQFRGRNLFGDLPGAPAKSPYDFVLRNGDGTIWVTGLRPRGKGFNLDVDARVDTSQWVEVTGTIQRERTLVTLQASKIASAVAPAAEPASEELAAPAPPPEPGEVVFSSPTNSETDVAVGTSVRVQFSRGLDPKSVDGNIKVSYAARPTDPGPSIEFHTKYDFATRSIEIQFAKPLERLRTVTVETGEGLRTFDGAPIRLWKLIFSVGG